MNNEIVQVQVPAPLIENKPVETPEEKRSRQKLAKQAYMAIYNTKYNDKNRNIINKKACEKVLCNICHVELSRSHLSRHKESKLHKRLFHDRFFPSNGWWFGTEITTE